MGEERQRKLSREKGQCHSDMQLFPVRNPVSSAFKKNYLKLFTETFNVNLFQFYSGYDYGIIGQGFKQYTGCFFSSLVPP